MQTTDLPPRINVPATLGRSSSGMRWFHTPEEYMSLYVPDRASYEVAQTPYGLGQQCPKCGKRSGKYERITYHNGFFPIPIGGEWSPDGYWKCGNAVRKGFFSYPNCGHAWKPELTSTVYHYTPEEWVFQYCIQDRVTHRRSANQIIRPLLQGGGMPASVAFGAMASTSNDPALRRDGMAMAGIGLYKQHQKQQRQAAIWESEDSQFDAEAQRAWDLALEYFRIPQRQAQYAEQERQREMREMARVMAEEMFRAARANS